MNKLELQKMAVEVRKGIVTGVHSAKSGHQVLMSSEGFFNLSNT